jgi:glycosyltransferase involved in cell wall biosynthesis
MKIGYLCSDSDVQVLGHQGCSVHIREFTDALVEAGHDVFIVCSWLGEAQNIHPKARIYQLDPTGKNNAVWQRLYDDPVVQNNFLDRDLRSVLWNTWLQSDGAEIMAQEKPEFIYERYALFGFGGLETCRRLQIPLILELNAPLCDQQEGYQKFPLIHTARQLEPQIIAGADAIVALTAWLTEWAVKLGADREKVHVLPDAVSHTLFAGDISGAPVRQKYDLRDRRVVGFVGSFHKWHDVAGLIDAFSQLIAVDPALRLLLVGDGHDRKKLEKKVRQLDLTYAVVFTGNVPHDQIPQYLAAMDVSVVPYQPIEDFFFSPMKLFESMAAGRPTVAADIGQISEVVRDGQTGLLYPPGDQQRLAQGIKRLLEDSRLSARIGAAARDYVLQHHTWRHVTSEVVRIARELLQT